MLNKARELGEDEQRAQGSACKSKAEEGEMGKQRECSEDAILAGGGSGGGGFEQLAAGC